MESRKESRRQGIGLRQYFEGELREKFHNKCSLLNRHWTAYRIVFSIAIPKQIITLKKR